MKVTRFNYYLNEFLISKLDLMIDRVKKPQPKLDCFLLIEGKEGEGKTTLSIACGYYISEKTGRSFNHTNVFADVEKLIKFAQETEEQIIIWDEPALHALSGDHASKTLKDLTRFLMMARKKRHFIIINVTYFNKFNDYLIWQRPVGMIHVYAKDNIPGYYIYIKQKNLEGLWQDWRKYRQRNYGKWAVPGVRGTFPDVLNPDYEFNVLGDFDINYYEKQKDDAIRRISSNDKKKSGEDSFELKKFKLQVKNAILQMKKPTIDEFAKKIGISKRTIYRWEDFEKPEETI